MQHTLLEVAPWLLTDTKIDYLWRQSKAQVQLLIND